LVNDEPTSADRESDRCPTLTANGLKENEQAVHDVATRISKAREMLNMTIDGGA
jgi:flagellar hook-basal body complex protein FliE